MASEVVDIRERIEKVRAEMAVDKASDASVNENLHSQSDNVINENRKNFNNTIEKSPLPDFKLTVQNPVSPKILLFLILMQLITSIALIAVIYFK